ncbi:MAG: winged helix-turn-helix domain-containing protein [Bryobacterales bacterium]|nr:winged helix-turn-helix domain-containing protein [Bryobacterales bacterium]
MAAAGAATQSGHQALVESAAGSARLARSPALRKLLLYLWEHREQPVSEYAIGVDVFGKREDFDPRTDATVRVQIGRLRQKLKEYAEAEGSGGAVRLTIPQGSHKLEFMEAPVVERRPEKRPDRRWMLTVGLVGAVLAVAALGWSNWALRRELAGANRVGQLPAVWQSMLRPGRLTRVIYPVPVFYAWGQLRVRDVLINDPEGWRSSANLAGLVEKMGAPQVSQSYSVASDTAAAIQLTRFLSGFGVAMEVSPTATLSLDKYGNENLVFLGIPPTNAALDQYVHRTNFYLMPGHGAVGNRRPASGEPEKFVGSTDAKNPAMQKRFGIIAVLPGHGSKSSLILFTGLATSSLATFLTSPLSLEEFSGRWESGGRPEYWEAVVEASVEGQTVKSARLAAFRVVAAKR